MQDKKGMSNWIFVVLLFILIISLLYSVYAYVNKIPFPWGEPGGGYLGEPINDSTVLRIIEEETNYYENKYNVTLPPINWLISEPSNESFAGLYSVGSSATWESSTEGWKTRHDKNATIALYAPMNKSEAKVRHTIRHEIGHHYLSSICKYGGGYNLYENYGADKVPNLPEPPNTFEEPFVEGYTSSTLNDWRKPVEKNMFYWDFKGLPDAMFECGFETCDLYGCYEKYTGEEWKA